MTVPGDARSPQVVLQCRGISMRFGKGPRATLALEDVDLEVARGEFLVLLGPSGCGKSTLLYLMAGLLLPTTGGVMMGGEIIRGPSPRRGVVFQDFALFPWLTVADNIRFGLSLSAQQRYQALSTKQIDAGAVPALFVPMADARFKGQFTVLFDFRDVPGIKDRPQINQLLLAVTDDYQKRERPALKAFLQRYLNEIRWTYANPAEAKGLLAKASKIELVKALPDPFGPNTDGRVDLPAMQLDIEMMHRYGYLKKTDFGAKKLVDHSVLDEILAGR